MRENPAPTFQPNICAIYEMSVQISPPGALCQRQQGGWDGLSRPLVLYPTNDI